LALTRSRTSAKASAEAHGPKRDPAAPRARGASPASTRSLRALRLHQARGPRDGHRGEAARREGAPAASAGGPPDLSLRRLRRADDRAVAARAVRAKQGHCELLEWFIVTERSVTPHPAPSAETRTSAVARRPLAAPPTRRRRCPSTDTPCERARETRRWSSAGSARGRGSRRSGLGPLPRAGELAGLPARWQLRLQAPQSAHDGRAIVRSRRCAHERPPADVGALVRADS
jgi:hypothetical protein